MHIDVGLETRLATDTGFELRYNDEAETTLLWSDARTIARQARTAEILTLTPIRDGWRLDRIDVEGELVIASVYLSDAPSVREARRATQALEHRESITLVEGERPAEPWRPTRVQPNEPNEAPQESPLEMQPAREWSVARTTAGLTLTALGIAALATGWAFWRQLERKHETFAQIDAFDSRYLTLQDQIDQGRIRAIALASVAGALLTVGLPVFLPRERPRWWSWALGAVGLGTTIAGVLLMLQDDECLGESCDRRTSPEARGALVTATGVPLLVLPFAQFLNRVSVTATASQTALVCRVGGVF